MQRVRAANIHSCGNADARFEPACDHLVPGAACPVATHSNGISAVQLQRQSGLGSYRTAWLLPGKLRVAMIDPGRNLLSGLVEVDETSIRQRIGHGAGGVGRSHEGKLMIAGAVEVEGQGAKSRPGRLRLAVIADYTSKTPHEFVATGIARDSRIKTDGLASCNNAPNMEHDKNVAGDRRAHPVLPWIHRVFCRSKAWAIGVCHGLRARHLQSFADEFVFRFNGRSHRHAGPETLPDPVVKRPPMTCRMLTGAELRC